MEKPGLPAPPSVGLGVADFKRSIATKLFYDLARFPAVATRNDNYLALAYTVRDRLLERWLATVSTYHQHQTARSATSRRSSSSARTSATTCSTSASRTRCARRSRSWGSTSTSCSTRRKSPASATAASAAWPPATSTRWPRWRSPPSATASATSSASSTRPSRTAGRSRSPDNWLRLGNPWEIPRPEIAFQVGFGGHTEHGARTSDGQLPRALGARPGGEGRRLRHAHPRLPHQHRQPAAPVEAAGLRVVRLRRPSTWATTTARSRRRSSRRTSPRCSTPTTRPLPASSSASSSSTSSSPARCRTCSASTRSPGGTWSDFHAKYAVQLNDTHPAIAVAELMRLLVDEHDMAWERAWEITTATFGYTNHTLLPEALEKWPLPLFQSAAAAPPGDHLRDQPPLPRRGAPPLPRRRRRASRGMSLIDESGPRCVRMANLACVGSHAVNGVAALHTRAPQARPSSATSTRCGRRSSATRPTASRPGASSCSPTPACRAHHPRDRRRLGDATSTSSASSSRWPTTPASGRSGARSSSPTSSASRTRSAAATGVEVDPASLFDVQVKRIHEYKRQHLNVLHVVALYQRLRKDPAHAAPAAHRHLRRQGRARLPHGEADHQAHPLAWREVVNADPAVRGRLQGGLPARLQRQELRSGSSPPPTSRSRSPPRARRPRAPAT